MSLSCTILTCLVLTCTTAMAGPPGPWFPPSEPSPFIPDDARWIANEGKKLTYFRGEWRIEKPVKRAVLVVAPRHTVRVYLNGRLLAEAYDTHLARPEWVETANMLRPGQNLIAARVHCDWRPELYIQMRVEYADGSSQDFITDHNWQWCDEPADDWATNPRAAGDWKPVDDFAGYARADGSVWGSEFALLPRQMLRERLQPHNRQLEHSWRHDRKMPGLRITQPPERKPWARQFRDFCHIDETTGQLIDGAGNIRHLFFTIYGQDGALSLPNMDLQQLERDLDLMAKAGVHIYMRNLGWNWLLTEDGRWAELEKQPAGAQGRRFQRAVDLLDHLVKRAWAHGRYIIFEGDFFWSAHSIIPPPYRTRYHLYPPVARAQALATRKIMHRYRNCTNVLGMMIGEEDIVLEHDLSNPHQRQMFADFLHRKYGTLADFKRRTSWGYDYDDRSEYVRETRDPEYWPNIDNQEVLAPRFTPEAGVLEHITQWSQVPLPLWPSYRSPEYPDVRLQACKSYNQFTPEDPLWIDFYEMREDELLFGMLCRWAETVREGMPNQLLFYSNAQDYTNSWHFLHLYRRAELPFDVIGVGCHDSDRDLSEIPPWATVRKAIKVISSYRPYALAPGSPAKGIASGEGCGGRPEHPQEVLNYYRGALFDEIGGGAAWTQTYAWDHISGATADRSPHMTPLLQWMSEFMPAVQGVEFSLRRPVQVIIVRNTNLAHSNMSGLDYANARQVAHALTQLNIEFDVCMDRDLIYEAAGDTPAYKINLADYRLVILPTVAIDFPDDVWDALDAWLRAESRSGKRVLAMGWIGDRGPRLAPKDSFHPVLQHWLGRANYGGTVDLEGDREVILHDGAQAADFTVDFGRVPPVGVFDGAPEFVQCKDGPTIAARFGYGANAVYAFGFPLGMAHHPLWGLPPRQQPIDALTPIYEAMVRDANVDRPILAPHNVRVYVANGARMILTRETAGLPTNAKIALRLPPDVTYPDLDLTRDKSGYSSFAVRLKPWEGRWWKSHP